MSRTRLRPLCRFPTRRNEEYNELVISVDGRRVSLTMTAPCKYSDYSLVRCKNHSACLEYLLNDLGQVMVYKWPGIAARIASHIITNAATSKRRGLVLL